MIKYLDQVTCSKFPSPHPTLPTLIALAFGRITGDLVEHLHAEGHTDLQLSHFMTVLRFVSADGVRQAHIARDAGVTPQAVSLAVVDLEKRGYVERVPDPADGRAWLVRWSARGREAALSVEHWFAELEDGWRQTLGDDAVGGARATLALVAGGDR